MKNGVIPTSPYAKISLEPLKSVVPSVTPIGNVFVIQHQGFYAEVSLYGGQVLKFKQLGQRSNPTDIDYQESQPIFWCTNTIHCGTSENGKETAIRGGVPICWPWFGHHPDNKNEKHGFARNSLWKLVSLDVTEQLVTVIIELSGVNQHALWPQAYSLTQCIVFSVDESNAFEQTLTMKNHSDETVQYTGAFHNYFHVSSPENVHVKALEKADYYDQLLDKDFPAASLEGCQGPIDRIYHSNDEMLFVDNGWARTLKVNSQHCKQWVLWNPGSDDAKSMKDVHQEGEQEFVCLEAANTQWQTIPANSSVSISQSISVY